MKRISFLYEQIVSVENCKLAIPCFKHTNSEGMRKKYYDTVNIKKLKEVIRNESKRKCLSQCA